MRRAHGHKLNGRAPVELQIARAAFSRVKVHESGLMGSCAACAARCGAVNRIDASFAVTQVTQWAQFSEAPDECQQPAEGSVSAIAPESADTGGGRRPQNPGNYK